MASTIEAGGPLPTPSAAKLPRCRIVVAAVAALLDQINGAPEDWLSATELSRLRRMQAEQRRQHYLSGHWLLRQLLSSLTGEEAWRCSIVDRPSLPPAIAEHPQLWVSLSHSGPWIACAISQRPIGIDLEQRRDRSALAGFEQLLRNPDEAPGSLDLDALLQRWVVKEAFIKRDCGSALPERLAELRLQPSDGPAEVSLWSSEDIFLGVAGAMGDELPTLPTDQQIRKRQHWRVYDLASIERR